MGDILEINFLELPQYEVLQNIILNQSIGNATLLLLTLLVLHPHVTVLLPLGVVVLHVDLRLLPHISYNLHSCGFVLHLVLRVSIEWLDLGVQVLLEVIEQVQPFLFEILPRVGLVVKLHILNGVEVPNERLGGDDVAGPVEVVGLAEVAALGVIDQSVGVGGRLTLRLSSISRGVDDLDGDVSENNLIFDLR